MTTQVPQTFWFNYHTGEIDKRLNQQKDVRWRMVHSVAYAFPLGEVNKVIPAAQSVYCYKSHITPTGKEIFYGYVVVRNKETGFLDPVNF